MDTIAQPPIRSRAAVESSRQISWLDLLLPAVLMLICFFVGITAIGLAGPDEPRYAAIARNMARTGDWITPRLNGQPWFEKPALYYWMAGLAFRVFGEGEFAMRFPSVLAAILASLAAGWAAMRAFGLDAARLTLLMLPVTIGLISFSHTAAGDMLFAALLTATAAAASEMLQIKRPGALTQIIFGFLLGAATLAKGPAAILLTGGAVLVWALASRQIAATFRFFHPLCLLAFSVTAIPWYALCAARNPDFLQIFFVQHNIERYLTPIFQHSQPFWFFIPVLLAGVFPFTVLIIPLIRDAAHALKSDNWRTSPALFFACWVIVPLLFFSFSESKLPSYILPAMPPLVLLLALTLSRRLTHEANTSRTWIVLVCCSLPLIVLSAGIRLARMPAVSEWGTLDGWLPTITIGFAGGLACALMAWYRRERAALIGVAILMAVLATMTAARALPALDPLHSARTAARITQQHTQPGGFVFFLGLDHSLQYGLEYYLEYPVPDWYLTMPKSALVWTRPSWLSAIIQMGLRYTVLDELPHDLLLIRIEPPPAP